MLYRQTKWVRARKEQLQGVLATLPWVAMVDEFQHWIYENKSRSHRNDMLHGKKFLVVILLMC